jgi:serine/threonine protein kinase
MQISAFLQRFSRFGQHPRVGDVALLEEIGRGGMGTVYAGWHVALEIPVAVKFLFAVQAEAEQVARFRREARLCAELDDPNLLRVLDFGIEEGVPYLVMEWVPGKGLDRVVAIAGPLTEEEVVTVMRDVGQALMTLHRRGIVHRDIKPANLLLRSTDGRIKIADLGIAKEMQAKDAIQTHQIVGTPAFVSPEQVRDPANVGPASDMFSLGATAFYLLTGKPPFAGSSVMEIFERVLNASPADPAESGAQLSDRLRGLLGRLSVKDPEQRIRSGEQLLQLLPSVSYPFRPQVLEAAKPDYQIQRVTADARQSSHLAPRDELHEAPTSADATSETVLLSSAKQAPRSLLFCQCLQNDFIAPLREGEPAPNRLHIGWEEATRIVGRDPAHGPLVRAVSAAATADNVRLVHIRDWHDADDPRQQPELAFFGKHCLIGSDGARFIDVIESFSRDRRRAAIVDSTGINDFEDTPLAEMISAQVGDADRATMPVGVIGVWTNVKVQYLLYDLKTRARLLNLATCSKLVASPDRVAHRNALRHLEEVLGVLVFHEVEPFLEFLGVKVAALSE